jgi:hypothetical protein
MLSDRVKDGIASGPARALAARRPRCWDETSAKRYEIPTGHLKHALSRENVVMNATSVSGGNGTLLEPF